MPAVTNKLLQLCPSPYDHQLIHQWQQVECIHFQFVCARDCHMNLTIQYVSRA